MCTLASAESVDRVGQQGQSAADQIVGSKVGASVGHIVSTHKIVHSVIRKSHTHTRILLIRHAHKSTVMDLKWNDNGNWLITASRDHLLKLFDLRNLKEEVQVFRGHKKEASAVSWHPVHEGLFSSGGSDGSILFWNVGTDKEVGAIEAAHDSIVWTLAWHPLGHILCSGSNDHTIKFWTRNRPGDQMRDKYNLNTLPVGLQGMEECEIGKYTRPMV